MLARVGFVHFVLLMLLVPVLVFHQGLTVIISLGVLAAAVANGSLRLIPNVGWICGVLAGVQLVGMVVPTVNSILGPSVPHVVMGGLTESSVSFAVECPRGTRRYLLEYGAGSVQSGECSKGNTIDGLTPSTSYNYSIRFEGENKLSGSFQTLPGKDDHKGVVFASTSCTQRRRLIWGAPLVGYKTLLDLQPQFLLFLGDFIYTDVPRGLGFHGFGFGNDKALYKQEFQSTFGDPYANEFYRHTPTFFMYDDHEIRNDYEYVGDDPVYETAIEMWLQHTGMLNPVTFLDNHYFTFAAGSGDFFVMDTTRFNLRQLTRLLHWLTTSSKRFKFIVSPQSFTSDILQGARKAILDVIERKNISTVMLITGDTHTAVILEHSKGVYEVSASPLSGFGKRLAFYDNVVFEALGMDSAFAVFEMKHETLGVKIYAGGDSLVIKLVCVASILGITLWALAVGKPYYLLLTFVVLYSTTVAPPPTLQHTLTLSSS